MSAELSKSELDKQCHVLVYTSELMFEGNLKFNISQRLLDALNEGVRETQTLKAIDFLLINDVVMVDARGNKTHANRVYVAKKNIIFVAQMSGMSHEKSLNTYPYRKKLPVGVTIYTAQIQIYALPYLLKGELYVETWGQVADRIESEEIFLPLTGVQVLPAPEGQAARYDFVAINKDHIISIIETSAEGT